MNFANMESPIVENKNPEVSLNESVRSSSNQFIPDNLDLPDDTFRMSLDNFSMIGENVTIGREISVESSTPVAAVPYTPTIELTSPLITPNLPTLTPDSTTPQSPQSPPIINTPVKSEAKLETRKLPTLFQLSLAKKNENDIFVKPSPVLEVMSPARMLQFEIEASSATPTMKRAAIDFDFFNKNRFDEYFQDEAEKLEKTEVVEVIDESTEGSTFKETPVIVKTDTVRHEIGYGK